MMPGWFTAFTDTVFVCPGCETDQFTRLDFAAGSGKCVNRHHVMRRDTGVWYCPDTESPPPEPETTPAPGPDWSTFKGISHAVPYDPAIPHDCEARCTRQHVPPDGTPFGAGFESVRIMRLQIDDVIVIEVDYPVTAKDIDAFKARIEATFPGHKAIVLDNGARLSVARPDADLGSVKPNPETPMDGE